MEEKPLVLGGGSGRKKKKKPLNYKRLKTSSSTMRKFKKKPGK